MIGKSIDGRISSKPTLRQRSRDNSKLTVFNCIIQDETSEIGVIAWDEVATKLFNKLKVGNCYRFSMYKVKEIANPAYRMTEHS